MNCVYLEEQVEGKYICKYCGTKRPIPAPANCKNKPKDTPATHQDKIPPPLPQPPSLLTRAKNFAVATVKHVANGSPQASAETIQKRLEICKACPLFKSENEEKTIGICTHEHCGCNIRQEQIFLNKLAWADQKCPIDSWGPELPETKSEEEAGGV